MVLGLAAAPAFAQGPPPPPGPFSLASLSTTVKLIQTVTVVGAGRTEAEAEANALALLNSSYIVLRVLSTRSFCAEIELPSTDPFGNHDTVNLCAAEVEARVIRKAIILVP
jgi:hypothetical protein